MNEKPLNIYIWIQNGKVFKAIISLEEGTVKIFNEEDKLIIKRTGLNRLMVKQIESIILKYGAKKLDKHAEPFKFL